MSSRSRPRYPLGLRLRTAVRRRHRLVAAALCAVALTLVILRLAPPDARTTPVLTVAADLPAGHALTAEDVTVSQFPVALAPAAAFSSPQDAIGQRTTVALTQGQAVTSSTVLGPGLLTGQPTGTTAASVRVADPAVLRHIRPGDLVDVVHHTDQASSGAGKTVARSVTVLWAATSDPGGGSSILSSGGSEDDAGLVVLAAPRDTATDLATLDGTGKISLVLVSP
ncbi:hypothetical protein KVA01_00910 [Kocuria varians]|uniref:SAF domain-containing protein n=1 Tax=Kocuria varians TaxID=1272 RepID=A0A4Y4D033_KOCVA|nr:Flp pilus assembly protein CpaB [Kocuria varians]GEC97936.1 hypothetical protein KVA01_00910 [Kocuria varians]